MIRNEAEARAFVEGLANPAQIGQLEKLIDLLLAENERQNLIAKASMPHIWQRHIADSAQLLSHVSRETLPELPWLDLGTGAGFPGLIAAILHPDQEVVLVESRRRRVEWLEACIAALGLTNCWVEGVRLEQLKPFPAAIISARAFAPLPKLLNLSAAFSTPDTVWVLPKGRKAAQELSQLPRRDSKLFHVEQSLTDPEAGIIVGHLAS